MNRIILSFLCVLLVSCGVKKPIKTTKVESKDIQKSNIHYSKEKHLQNIKQLTFGGDNAEAYFSFDDTRLVFQLKNPETGIWEHHEAKWVTWEEMRARVPGFLKEAVDWAQSLVE